jgi:hypothetical protein
MRLYNRYALQTGYLTTCTVKYRVLTSSETLQCSSGYLITNGYERLQTAHLHVVSALQRHVDAH